MVDITNFLVLEMMGGQLFDLSEISSDDFDVKSDAKTSHFNSLDVVEVFSDEEGCVDDILHN